MTFSSYLQRTKLFGKAVSQRFRVLLLIATFSVLMMSSLTNMNTLDISMLSQDCEQSVPDSPEMINLKCVVPNFLPQESRPKQFLSSDQKSNMLFTVFFSQNVPSSEHSFLRPLFKTSITTMYRAHLCPAPGRRLALRRPVCMKTTSQTYKASNHPHQSRKFYMTKQTQRNRVN